MLHGIGTLPPPFPPPQSPFNKGVPIYRGEDDFLTLFFKFMEKSWLIVWLIEVTKRGTSFHLNEGEGLLANINKKRNLRDNNKNSHRKRYYTFTRYSGMHYLL